MAFLLFYNFFFGSFIALQIMSFEADFKTCFQAFFKHAEGQKWHICF